MKVGITLPNLGPQATRENILTLATRSEKEGFDSLWTITRVLWPLKPQTPYAATPDGSLPIEYQIALDPLDVLTYVASNTNKIELGTSVIDMFFYTPIMLAKRFATLDLLSQGRSSIRVISYMLIQSFFSRSFAIAARNLSLIVLAYVRGTRTSDEF
jgi:alkanesulfonate monooxygenase SsuD/methylene tetrahydromethanopterin reductase-like flavin-dependent oxidoreductase (luciferase family)